LHRVLEGRMAGAQGGVQAAACGAEEGHQSDNVLGGLLALYVPGDDDDQH
jgi:hypothetical protein